MSRVGIPCEDQLSGWLTMFVLHLYFIDLFVALVHV